MSGGGHPRRSHPPARRRRHHERTDCENPCRARTRVHPVADCAGAGSAALAVVRSASPGTGLPGLEQATANPGSQLRPRRVLQHEPGLPRAAGFEARKRFSRCNAADAGASPAGKAVQGCPVRFMACPWSACPGTVSNLPVGEVRNSPRAGAMEMLLGLLSEAELCTAGENLQFATASCSGSSWNRFA